MDSRSTKNTKRGTCNNEGGHLTYKMGEAVCHKLKHPKSKEEHDHSTRTEINTTDTTTDNRSLGNAKGDTSYEQGGDHLRLPVYDKQEHEGNGDEHKGITSTERITDSSHKDNMSTISTRGRNTMHSSNIDDTEVNSDAGNHEQLIHSFDRAYIPLISMTDSTIVIQNS